MSSSFGELPPCALKRSVFISSHLFARRDARGRAFCVAVFVLLAATASAHTRSLSYSLWDVTDAGAMVRVRISRLELTRLALDPVRSPADERVVLSMLPEVVRMSAAGEWCTVADPPRRTAASEGNLAYAWRLECGSTEDRAIESRLLLDVAPSHMHFARLRRAGEPTVERVLTEAAPVWRIDRRAAAGPDSTGGTSLVGYLALGVEHILTGWDHLAFVFALLLLAGGLRDIAMLVTSFTIAHSITLALAVLGFVEPTGHVVEALIGYSIALVGVENAWLLSGKGRVLPALVVTGVVAVAAVGSSLPLLAVAGLALFSACHFGLLRRSSRPERLRAAVAFSFGLIHGFGFAGIMMELDLESVRLAPALFGFNVGVELGQLAVVALVWPLLLALRRAPSVSSWVDDLGSAAVTGLGLFWFLTRSFS